MKKGVLFTMATVIRATCSEASGGKGCGDVRVPSLDVVLRYTKGKEEEGGQYRFVCPTCKRIILKDASFTIVSLLQTSGVRTELIEPPLELLERPREDEGAPITLDDIIDLGLQLEQDEEGWFQRLKFRGGK